MQPQRRCRWSPGRVRVTGSRLTPRVPEAGRRVNPRRLRHGSSPEHLCTRPDGSACATGWLGAPVAPVRIGCLHSGPTTDRRAKERSGCSHHDHPWQPRTDEAEALAPTRKRIASDRRTRGLPLGKRSSDRGTRACPRETVPSGTEAKALAPRLTWTEALAPRPTWNGAYATRIRTETVASVTGAGRPACGAEDRGCLHPRPPGPPHPGRFPAHASRVDHTGAPLPGFIRRCLHRRNLRSAP